MESTQMIAARQAGVKVQDLPKEKDAKDGLSGWVDWAVESYDYVYKQSQPWLGYGQKAAGFAIAAVLLVGVPVMLESSREALLEHEKARPAMQRAMEEDFQRKAMAQQEAMMAEANPLNMVKGIFGGGGSGGGEAAPPK